MWLASLGELLLVATLVWTSYTLWPLWRRCVHLASDKAAAIVHQALTQAAVNSAADAATDPGAPKPSARKGWQPPEQGLAVLLLISALLLVALTATFGAVRYALQPTPDFATAATAAQYGLLVTVHDNLSFLSRQFAMPCYVLCALWLWGRVPALAVVALVLVSQLPLLGAPGIVNDAVLLVSLLRLVQQATKRRPLAIGIGCLLGVPLCSLLIADANIAMGVFHLLLALHFVGFALTLPALPPRITASSVRLYEVSQPRRRKQH